MTTMHRARAILKIAVRNTASCTTRANAICEGLDVNQALFANPTPSIKVLRDQIDALQQAELVVAKHTPGAAAARNVVRNTLIRSMEASIAYVQSIADQSATWDQAEAVIKAGGLVVATIPTRVKAILEVRPGAAPGSVILDANKGALTAGLRGNVAFNWQSTLDGSTFVTLPPTPKHKTTVANLAPLVNHGFRVAVTGSDGVLRAWSQAVFTVIR